MKIIKMLSQYRRDFQAVYRCENCGQEAKGRGYDDRNFHDNVVPNMKCKKCGNSRNDLGIKGDFTETRYPEGFQI